MPQYTCMYHKELLMYGKYQRYEIYNLFGTVLDFVLCLFFIIQIYLCQCVTILVFVTDLWSREEARAPDSVHYVSPDHRLQHQSSAVL